MSTDMRIREYCLRTNLDLFLIAIIVAGYCYYADADVAAADVHGTTATAEAAESKAEVAVNAVFFPWFAQALGLVVYYVLSRYVRAIPFTAMMFLIGLAIGIGVEVGTSKRTIQSVPVESAATWMRIPGELLLVVFLPGLLYVDAYGIDVHLFLKSFSQLFTFAFPMVLAGTALTALVAYYILPFGWSFDLCMTFGAILSATDPVAVSVLMNELGAP